MSSAPRKPKWQPVNLIASVRSLISRLDSIGYILLGVMFVCAFQLARVIAEYSSRIDWIKVDAVVVGMTPQKLGRGASDGKMPLLQVDAVRLQYRYWVQGSLYEGTDLSARKRSTDIPYPLDIFCNPKDPSQSTTKNGMPWGLVFVLGVGIVVSVSALFIWQHLRAKVQSAEAWERRKAGKRADRGNAGRRNFRGDRRRSK